MSDTSPGLTHFVKVREKTAKAFWFLTPKGGMNRLRVHASQFTEEQANKAVEEINRENPHVIAKAVLIWDGKKAKP